ncbi:MAG: OmpH family outer membrane protein [Acidobacteria bacterium]|nr:OmpH family outer membrane protein [Acidobacteriota bacterium]
MKRVTTLVTVGVWLVAAAASAQQPPPQTPPPQTQTPPPAQAQKPPAPPVTPPPAQAPTFPPGSRMAFLDVQRLATESAEGKAAAVKITEFQKKKTSELAARNKTLEAAQQKMAQSGAVMSDDARVQLQKEIEKQQLEIQRAQQDAQSELDELNRQLNAEFQRRLAPVIQQVSVEKGLIILFSRADAGIVWADSGLDLTADIIRRFDAAAATAKPAAPKPPKL